jgi:hypothetical protein
MMVIERRPLGLGDGKELRMARQASGDGDQRETIARIPGPTEAIQSSFRQDVETSEPEARATRTTAAGRVTGRNPGKLYWTFYMTNSVSSLVP